MKQTYWIDQLLQLRRTHLSQWKAFHNQEIHYRHALTQQYKDEKPFYCSVIEKAMLIQRQTDRILELSQDRAKRCAQLRKDQMAELYTLFQTKNCLSLNP